MGADDAPGDPEVDPPEEGQGEPAGANGERATGSQVMPVSDPEPDDVVDEWGYESFPASDPPQH